MNNRIFFEKTFKVKKIDKKGIKWDIKECLTTYGINQSCTMITLLIKWLTYY